MTELELLKWILGILIAGSAVALLVLYFFRCENNPVTVGIPTGTRDVCAKKELPIATEEGSDNQTWLRKGLLAVASGHPRPIASSILESAAYEEIQRCIRDGLVLSETGSIWEELENAIAKSSPKFKSRLYVLGGGGLKPSDLHMALLIRCGISPVNIAMLVGRSKSTITFRRKDMGRKLFDRDLDANRLDELIRLI